VHPVAWVAIAAKTFLKATFLFTIVSALHYVFLVGQRMRAMNAHETPPSNPS